ncbi:hypothetical protein MC885_007813 [Smutsia gigantea]|nr:hypothetical protein MC885_007813 [Smutsia gigantea]
MVLLRRQKGPVSLRSRLKFYVREPRHDKPDWLKVGMTLGTSIFLWTYLIKQHNEDVLEQEDMKDNEPLAALLPMPVMFAFVLPLAFCGCRCSNSKD